MTLYMKVYFSLYEKMYNDNIYSLLYKRVYNNNKRFHVKINIYFYYIRRYIIKINIYFNMKAFYYEMMYSANVYFS